MTLLKMDGMDMYGATSDIARRADGVPVSGYSLLSTGGRYGGGAIQVTDDDRHVEYATTGSPQTAVFSFAVMMESTPTDTFDIVWKVMNSTSSDAINFTVASGTNVISIKRDTTTLGSFALTISVWHWVSIKVKMATTAVGSVDVEVDGISVLSQSSIITTSSGTEVCEALALGASVSADFKYDDVIVTDVAGGAPFNDLLSDRRIDTIRPNAAGDSSNFTASPVVANYLNVDDTAPDDDTTYNESNTSTNLDLYNMESMNFSPSSIDAINVVALAKNPDAGSPSLKLKTKTGTTEGTGAAQSPTSGYGYLDELFLTDPDTAVAWTESGVNAMQAGQEIT